MDVNVLREVADGMSGHFLVEVSVIVCGVIGERK